MYELMIENARTDGFFKPGTFLIVVQFPPRGGSDTCSKRKYWPARQYACHAH